MAAARSPGGLKVVIVGCGKIAEGHAEEVAKLAARARVVAVCDRELLLAEQFAARHGVPHHYDDFARLLERERPDVVHITAPPHVHLPLARQAIDAGCHLYVEKPFTLSAEDSRALIDHAQAAGRKVTVGYASFFDPPALRMRELVAEGTLGEPVHVESFFGYALDSPFGQAMLADPGHWVHRLPGRLFHNIIDHAVSKVCEFLPDERPRVLAHASALRPQRFGDARDQLQDELRVLLAGARVSAYVTFSAHARPVGQFVRVYGTRNTLAVDYVARTVTLDRAATLPSAIGRLLPAFQQAGGLLREGAGNVWRFARSDFHYFAGLQTQLGRFYDCIVRDGPPPYPYRDIVRVSELLDEIFRQVGQGREP
jgi:predicted dehydrogenase